MFKPLKLSIAYRKKVLRYDRNKGVLIFGLFSLTLIKTSENQSRMCSTDCMTRL